MGGGGSPPAPKTFTPPPLQEAPVSAPIPNFFGNAGNRPPSPYEAMSLLGQQPARNPFGGLSQQMPQFTAPQRNLMTLVPQIIQAAQQEQPNPLAEKLGNGVLAAKLGKGGRG